MPFLSTIEEVAIQKNQQKNIISILKKRFGDLPEDLISAINQIDDLAQLERLHLETISVNSLEEFKGLMG
jgi:hypothetical protein